MNKRYDVVWFWSGGRVEGKWCPSVVRAVNEDRPTWEEVREHCGALDRSGYVNHPGTRSIGAPDGPPDDSEFRALGL